MTFPASAQEEGPLGKFEKVGEIPILMPQGTGFECKAVFNPAAIVVNDTVFMFYRAENWEGTRPDKDGRKWKGTSTIGMAYSVDGIHFERHPEPVIRPEDDYETPGGCEDPRIVKIGDTYYLTYTAYNARTARLALATSKDLINWRKKGIVIPREWSKAGAILTEKVNGKYVMYFGDQSIWTAYSDDLLNWTVDDDPVLQPREGHFDDRIVEPGPPPFMTDDGILLIYNGSTKDIEYETGWVIFAKDDPKKIVARCEKPILTLSRDWERQGQVPNVIFAEGLVRYKSRWLLYYGAADTYIGVAASAR